MRVNVVLALWGKIQIENYSMSLKCLEDSLNY